MEMKDDGGSRLLGGCDDELVGVGKRGGHGATSIPHWERDGRATEGELCMAGPGCDVPVMSPGCPLPCIVDGGHRGQGGGGHGTGTGGTGPTASSTVQARTPDGLAKKEEGSERGWA